MKIELWFLFFVMMGMILGSCVTLVYQEYTQSERIFDGLRFENNLTQQEAIQSAKSWDNNSDWVCINVKGMEYSYAVNICKHEVAHEIFAKYCEYNMNKCINLTYEK